MGAATWDLAWLHPRQRSVRPFHVPWVHMTPCASLKITISHFHTHGRPLHGLEWLAQTRTLRAPNLRLGVCAFVVASRVEVGVMYRFATQKISCTSYIVHRTSTSYIVPCIYILYTGVLRYRYKYIPSSYSRASC